MSTNPVTTDDVADRWRPLSDQETSNAQALITSAWAILQTQAPAATSATGDETSDELIRYVMVTAVLRVLKNPDLAKSESVDDYSFTRFDGAVSGDLYFTDADLALLRGVAVPRVATVSMDSWA